MAKLTIAREIIKTLIPDIHSDEHLSPSEYITNYWQHFKRSYPSVNNTTNGAVFEELIAITLVRQQIFPFYMQAKIKFVPNAIYDFVVYCEDIGPLVLSAKTSLRERYKQALLEAVVLKNVHRKSQSFVVSLDENEVKREKRKLDEGIAINDVIYAASSNYDTLLQYISTKSRIEAPIFKTVESKLIITPDSVKTRWTY